MLSLLCPFTVSHALNSAYSRYIYIYACYMPGAFVCVVVSRVGHTKHDALTLFASGSSSYY